jgi:hypothetical protein
MLQQSQTNDINQEEYNGWKNRETWLVNLWINNNPYLQAELLDIIKSDVGIYLKVQDLRDLVEDTSFDHINESSGISTDLVNTALARASLSEIIELNSAD